MRERTSLTFGSSVNKLAAVHAFNCDEKLSVLLEFVLISETNLSERSASAWVVNNVLHDSLDVSIGVFKLAGQTKRAI